MEFVSGCGAACWWVLRLKLGMWNVLMLIMMVGVHSSIDGADRESQAIWSMAFENLNPKTLAKDHARMVKELYGDEVSTKAG